MNAMRPQSGSTRQTESVPTVRELLGLVSIYLCIYQSPYQNRVWHKAFFKVGAGDKPEFKQVAGLKISWPPSVFPLKGVPQTPDNKPNPVTKEVSISDTQHKCQAALSDTQKGCQATSTKMSKNTNWSLYQEHGPVSLCLGICLSPHQNIVWHKAFL